MARPLATTTIQERQRVLAVLRQDGGWLTSWQIGGSHPNRRLAALQFLVGDGKILVRDGVTDRHFATHRPPLQYRAVDEDEDEGAA